LEEDNTRVQVNTAKTFAGLAGQKNWDNKVLTEMQKALSKNE